jgi:hypothetical protein
MKMKLILDRDCKEGGNGGNAGGNFRPIKPSGGSASGGEGDAAMFIQKSSKMNDMTEFDEGFDEEGLF